MVSSDFFYGLMLDKKRKHRLHYVLEDNTVTIKSFDS